MISTPVTSLRDIPASLAAIHDPQERLARIVEMGRAADPLPEACKTDDHLVPGCLSRLWLLCEYRDGKCWFRCDSDSAVVKGIASLICQFYSGRSPQEVLAHEPDFLAQMGIRQHLSANRRNGLARVRGMIAVYAGALCGDAARTS